MVDPDDGGADSIARRAIDAAAKATTRAHIAKAAGQWAEALANPHLLAMTSGPAVIGVELVHAWPQGEGIEQWTRALRLPANATVGQALWASGFVDAFPAVDLDRGGIGVYGQLRGPHDVLRDGDRIEIYRPLDFDPTVSRRRRAAHALKARDTRKTSKP